MTVRVGIIGTGFGARVVAPAFAITPGCDVVDVVSARDADAVTTLCARPDVDLVSVHSPPSLHQPHVLAALDAGHAVLCDKPFGRTVAEAMRCVEAARAAGVPAFVNFEFRWDPARRHVRDLLAAGALGSVEHVSWVHRSAGSRVPLRSYGWLFDARSGGGWLGAWGSHALDALRWWLGPWTVATARLETRIVVRPDATGARRHCDAEDGFTVGLVGPTGATAAIDSSFAAVAPTPPRCTVWGSEASLEVIADRRAVLRSADGARDEWQAPARPTADPHAGPMAAQAAAVRDVLHGAAPAPDLAGFADGLAVRRLLDAVRAAARGA